LRKDLNSNPDVSIVIVSFNTRDLLRDCLNTVARECGSVTYEILVVDSASRDGSVEMVAKEFPEVRLITSSVNLGFAGANNRAFPACRGRYVVLLNSDAFLTSGALPLSVKHMEENPRVGIGGARLVGRDGGWQPSARMFPSILNDLLMLSGLSGRFPKSRFFGRVDRTWASPLEEADVDWVPGAYSIIRRDALEKVGYFDSRFFLYYEEVDLCRRFKNEGYGVHYWPDIEVIHLGGESSKTLRQLKMSSAGAQLTLWRMRSALLYYRKHHGSQAWLAKQIESAWHALRARRNSGSSKSEESAEIIRLMDRAWKDTSGGTVSPAQPW
jgi:GT2 family glycosyltransferase